MNTSVQNDGVYIQNNVYIFRTARLNYYPPNPITPPQIRYAPYSLDLPPICRFGLKRLNHTKRVAKRPFMGIIESASPIPYPEPLPEHSFPPIHYHGLLLPYIPIHNRNAQSSSGRQPGTGQAYRTVGAYRAGIQWEQRGFLFFGCIGGLPAPGRTFVPTPTPTTPNVRFLYEIRTIIERLFGFGSPDRTTDVIGISIYFNLDFVNPQIVPRAVNKRTE